MNQLLFDNRFVAELPGDPEEGPRRRQVERACWSRVLPTPVAEPRLLAHSREVAELLGLSEADVAAPEFASVFGGNALLPGMQPYAACYGGHQFGHWAGQLGDGRAITLGEVVNAQGQRWELQLKGAGPTPYARRADGRAVLRSSVREFLCSEAMHHLGVPTTRALSLVATGDQVVRDMFYDGRPRLEPGAVVCRVAPSFIRFGNFEIFAARRDQATLEQLVDFTIARDFPELAGDRARWFEEVCMRTARMAVHWMRVGFVHGVMNTDNMSILGLTIDYGPYGWIDNFDLDWTPNTTDADERRYRFGHQPAIAQWNLGCLATALRGLFPTTAPLEAGLARFAEVYTTESRAMTAAKLGLGAFRDADAGLVAELYGLMQRSEVDMTIFFRRLALLDAETPSLDPLVEAFYREELRERYAGEWERWLRRYAERLRDDGAPPEQRRSQMDAANPQIVLRNYLAQEAIDRAEQGDPGGIHTLLEALRRPYDDQPQYAEFARRRPDWARQRAGCSMLSCSS
ncbi:MAG TPA: YdiU family protein [Roseiflexaceae bacterium]|nr:YdiU family protein [Roseiflexaceae bacterium]